MIIKIQEMKTQRSTLPLIKHTLLKLTYISILTTTLLSCESKQDKSETVPLLNAWAISGEPTDESIILHARIASADTLVNYDIPGAEAVGYFEISEDQSFKNPIRTSWLSAIEKNDYILKARVKELKSGTQYYYRVVFGKDSLQVAEGIKGEFNTLPGANSTAPVSFIAVTGMNYGKFVEEVPYKPSAGQPNQNYVSATPEEKKLGFPAFETILKDHKPTFWVGDGDNVYYDSPSKDKRAIAQNDLRAKWHRLFAFPRAKKFFASVPTYWLKDDHDYRFNDSDTTNEDLSEPSHELGVYTFKEQIPITDLNNKDEKTYRTHRLNKYVQIWFVEGRDYRSPLSQKDGPDKTIWGKAQSEWLKSTLLSSDATYKILLSPTPLVGPDDHRPKGDTVTLDKRDNHTDPGGYRFEGDAFFTWLAENKLNSKNFFIVNGDRHWQYHSIHPSGIHEFSTGAFVKQNARVGRKPGEQNSTDPRGLIKQPYIQEKPTGAFLKVSIVEKQGQPEVSIEFIEETGEKLYAFVLPK
jgi:alkaline phosphatase D